MSKRFYESAIPRKTGGEYAIELDGRPVKTPAGKAFKLPTLALAEAIAEEWNAQGDAIDPHSMPLMRFCGTAIDRAPEVRDDMIEGLLRYGQTDLLCYRAADPKDLARKQDEAWQPLLDWAADEWGARLTSTQGVVPVSQDAAAHGAFKVVLEDIDNWTLVGLGELVGITGSLVVGLAVLKGRLDADLAFAVCHVDEDHQSALWGEDDQARQRREQVRIELHNAARYVALLKA